MQLEKVNDFFFPCTYGPINGRGPMEMHMGPSLGFISTLMIPGSKQRPSDPCFLYSLPPRDN